MKKIFLLLILGFGLTLSGCKSEGYSDPEDALQAFLDFYTDAGEGKDVDAEEVCDTLAKGDFISECIEFIEMSENEALDTPIYSWEYIIIDSDLEEMSEIAKNEYGFGDFDTVYELEFEFELETIWEEGDPKETDTATAKSFFIKEDGKYYIIDLR